jgi:cobalt transport protein
MRQGTDEKAQEFIQNHFPAYEPWMKSLFQPNMEHEKMLFSLQAFLGLLLLTLCVFQLKRSRKGRIP